MTSERQETENRDEFGYSESDIVKHHGNPVWEAIWSTIKRWDISRKNDGLYSSATGTDVQVIFDAVAAALRATPRAVRASGPEDDELASALVREIDHYRNLLADAYVTIGCAVASENGLDGSEADAFHAKVRRLWPAAVDHPTVAKWLALPEEGTAASCPAVPDETREAEVFTASAGTCRRCKSRVRMGGPAPDSCTNCAAPAESHPSRAVPASGERETLGYLIEYIVPQVLDSGHGPNAAPTWVKGFREEAVPLNPMRRWLVPIPTHDHAEAIRGARKQDAKAVLTALGVTYRGVLHVTEHMWVERRALASPAAAPRDETWSRTARAAWDESGERPEPPAHPPRAREVREAVDRETRDALLPPEDSTDGK